MLQGVAMSLAGLAHLDRALTNMMSSKTFKEADEGERLHMGYEMIRYGTPVKKLEFEEEKKPKLTQEEFVEQMNALALANKGYLQ